MSLLSPSWTCPGHPYAGNDGIRAGTDDKARKKTANVPIIFLTAYYGKDQHIVEGYGVGAIDYLSKPVNPAILRAKVRALTELYRKHRILEETNRVLAAVVESSDEAIVSKDLNGIIATFNPGAERLFGYKAEEMIGKPGSSSRPIANMRSRKS